MSAYSASESSSIFTSRGTFSSSSTIPGLGYYSGKVIERLGSAVVNGVDAILIRHRLAQIKAKLGPKSDGIAKAGVVKTLYDDLLELSRPIYGLSIRTQAFQVIMSKVGGMVFEDLAQAVADWSPSESYNLLKTMMACLHLDTSHLPFFSSENVSPMSFAMPLLLFIALLVALSSKPSFSRLVTEAGLPSFINNFYPTISIAPLEQRRYLYPACSTIQSLLEVLDTEIDSLSIPRLKCILDGTFHQSTPSHFTVSQHDWPESMGPLRELQYRVNERCAAAGSIPSFSLPQREERRSGDKGGYSATSAEVENLSRFWRAEQGHQDSSPKVISG
ncbi:hypothetical protein FB446DRAFT_775315 [Lentinula raphanica]|nr:hypothetical protein FB446DRAFT_775315 [Lentinula raphanica]